MSSSRIVSVKLWGGLCNRLFQIAFCYSFAKKYDLTPIFYKYLFEYNDHTKQDETIRIIKELIPHINISDDVVYATNFYIIDVKGDLACKYIDIDLPKHTDKNILLQGYFQSEKYFSILEDSNIPHSKFLYTFVNDLIVNKNCSQNLNKYFIHIRMGDYVNHYLHYLGYKNYLAKSINLILDRNPNATFIILSNEKDKKKIINEITQNTKITLEDDNNLLSRINYEFEIDINPTLDPLQSLKNMAMCVGGICMNSSFSWFGAYLSRMISNIQYNTKYENAIQNAIFTMPNKWFNEKYISKDTYEDIYPQWDNLVILDI